MGYGVLRTYSRILSRIRILRTRTLHGFNSATQAVGSVCTLFYVRVRIPGGNTTSHPAFRHLILACALDDGFAWHQMPILAIPMQCTLHVHRESPLLGPHARRVERLHI